MLKQQTHFIRTHINFYLLTFLIFLFFSLPTTSGQSDQMVSQASWDVGDLSGDQLTRYQKIINSPNSYDEIVNINIGNLANSLQDGRLRLDLANTDCDEIIYKVKRVEYLSESDYMWYGQLESSDLCPCGEGDLLLMSKNGEKFGTINFNKDQYRIADLTNGKNIAIKSPTPNGNEFICNGTATPSSANLADDIVETRGGGNCDVRVLVLYSPSIGARLTNVENTAISDVAYTNNVLGNSYVNASSLRFKLVDVIESPISEDGESMFWFLSKHETNQTVKDLRTSNDADLVIIYGDRDLMSPQSSAGDFGLAHAGISSNPAVDKDAYGIVGHFGSTDNAWKEETFAHEIAHILGAKHELCSTSGANSGCSNVTSSPGHAHNVGETTCSTGSGLKTIMFSAPSDDYIPHYSNPLVDYKEVGATGTSTRDNSKILKDNACTVAGYRNATNELAVFIDGVSAACPFEVVDFYADIQGAPGPYQYEWRVGNTNGTGYGNVVSTTYDYAFTLPDISSGTVTLQVKVTAGDGSIKMAWHTIQLLTEGCSGVDMELIDNTSNDFIASHMISPNPAIGYSTLELELSITAKVKVSIQNYNGTELLKISEKFFEKGIHILDLNTSYLQSGFYYVKMQTDKKIYMEKLLIFK